MAKKLDSFIIEINLNGWYNKKDKKSYRTGQKFKGTDITERMVEAVESEDTYYDKKTGKTHRVVELLSGTASDLRASFDNYEPEAPKVEPVLKVEEPKEEKKPVRRARPKDD